MKTFNQSLWERGVKAALLEARAIAETPLVGKIATLIPSESNSNVYPWIGEAPVMQLLKDEVQKSQLTDARYEVTNKTYAIMIGIGVDDAHDDQLGAQMMRAKEMSRVALNFANGLLTTALINGTSVTGFDGVSFFNDSHPIRGAQTAVQDNLLAGTGATASAIKTDIGTVIAAAMNWRAENGEPLAGSRSKFAIMVPPALLFAANEAVYAAMFSNTSNEAFRGISLEVMANPRLSDANDWYAFDVSGGALPLIYQEARAIKTEILGPGSDHYVKHEEVLIKCSWRGAAGYNHPGLAFKVVNS